MRHVHLFTAQTKKPVVQFGPSKQHNRSDSRIMGKGSGSF